MNPLKAISARRAAAADWNAKAAAAQPGEVWTSGYVTENCTNGGHFESYEAGTVRILGEECPVEEYRGLKVLGEVHLSGNVHRLTWWQRQHPATCYRLELGDIAPLIPMGTGARLAALPGDAWVHVEHRSDHPVCAGMRSVDVGYLGEIEDFDDGMGPGRYVGDSWIRLAEVTGLEWLDEDADEFVSEAELTGTEIEP